MAPQEQPLFPCAALALLDSTLLLQGQLHAHYVLMDPTAIS